MTTIGSRAIPIAEAGLDGCARAASTSSLQLAQARAAVGVAGTLLLAPLRLAYSVVRFFHSRLFVDPWGTFAFFSGCCGRPGKAGNNAVNWRYRVWMIATYASLVMAGLLGCVGLVLCEFRPLGAHDAATFDEVDDAISFLLFWHILLFCVCVAVLLCEPVTWVTAAIQLMLQRRKRVCAAFRSCGSRVKSDDQLRAGDRHVPTISSAAPHCGDLSDVSVSLPSGAAVPPQPAAATSAASTALPNWFVRWQTVWMPRVRFVCSLALGVFFVIDSMRGATGAIEVRRVDLYLPRWPGALDDYSIALASDLHLSCTTGRSAVADVVRSVNALHAHLVVLCGDIADAPFASRYRAAAPLAELSARDGVVAVLGNHEHYYETDQWSAHFSALGLRVLRNRALCLPLSLSTNCTNDTACCNASSSFDLIGLDDAFEQPNLDLIELPFGPPVNGNASVVSDSGPGSDDSDLDLDSSVRPVLQHHHYDADPVRRSFTRPTIVLQHQPLYFSHSVRRDADLQLSGHTHGGYTFPLSTLMRVWRKGPFAYTYGHYTQRRSHLFVTSGVRFYGPAMRMNVPREIALIVVHPI